MAVVVVAGQTREVGKTSVICGVVSALAEMKWTAVKVSVHGHGEGVVVREETGAGAMKDSERYLAAGAERAYYISAPPGGLWRAMPHLLDVLAGAGNALVESASVLEYLRPELALAVVDPEKDEVKESLQRVCERIDAVVTTGAGPLKGGLEQLKAKPRFAVCPPVYGSEALSSFVRTELENKLSAPRIRSALR